MFNIILRVSILCLIEYISFELMRPADLNFEHIKSFFIFWIIVNLFLMFRGLADFGALSSLGMIGQKNPQTRMASEAAERMSSTYKYPHKKLKDIKFSNEHLSYIFCIILNLVLYFIFKIFF